MLTMLCLLQGIFENTCFGGEYFCPPYKHI